MQESVIIRNGIAVLPDGVSETDILVENGVITDVGRQPAGQTGTTVIDAGGKHILPGFIDIHTNGIAGFDLTNGVYNPETGDFASDEETYTRGLDSALKSYAGTGTTCTVLTSLAAPLAGLKRVFSYVDKYTRTPSPPPWSQVFGGLYIEGTFMKLADYRGAHNPKHFNEPSRKIFDELQESAGGLIRIVNVVPEWGSKGVELIRYLSARGIVCAAGHTGATGAQYIEAIESGTRLAIHFPNGPTGSSYKPFEGGGAVETVLRSEEVVVEIIADGFHLDRSYVMDTIARKGFDRTVVVTDSMFPTLMTGLKDFSMFGVDGKVSRDGKYLQIADRGNALFGSTLTMDKAFTHILDWLTVPVKGVWHRLHEPMSFEDALMKASVMCSENPAKVLRIFQPEAAGPGPTSTLGTGSIEAGKRADLVVAEIERGENKRLNIEQVFVKGRPI